MQRLFSILFFLFICFPSMAQTDANVQYLFLPPVFETISEKVMVKPADIAWTKKWMVWDCCFCENYRGEGMTWVNEEIPPQYKTITYQVLKQNSKKFIYHPPVFETVRDSVMVKPAMGKWVKVGERKDICLCSPSDNCLRWEFKETPAEYKIIAHEILKSPAYFEDSSISNEEEIEVFEVSQIAEKTSFKKSVEVQNSHFSLQFYPNPASEFVTIEVQAPIEELFVTDFTGKTLLHFKQLNEILSFSVNTFPSGIYFLRYPDGNFWRSERLVVVR